MKTNQAEEKTKNLIEEEERVRNVWSVWLSRLSITALSAPVPMEVENFLTQVVYTKKLYRIVKVNSPFGISQRFILHFLLLTALHC